MIATPSVRRAATCFGPLQIAISLLVGATALVHLWLAVGMAIIVVTQPDRKSVVEGKSVDPGRRGLFNNKIGGWVVLGVAHYLPALRQFQRVTRCIRRGFNA